MQKQGILLNFFLLFGCKREHIAQGVCIFHFQLIIYLEVLSISVLFLFIAKYDF